MTVSAPSRGRRVRRDRGQTSGEFLGLIVVAAIMIGVLAPAGFGNQIGSGIQAAICRIMGGSCSLGADAASDHVPSECTTLSSGQNLNASVTVFSVKVGGDVTLTLSRSVDRDGRETWSVEEERAGDVGLSVMAPGGGVSVNGTGVEEKAEASVSLTGGGGFKYDFDSEQEARDFLTSAQHQLAKDAVANGSPLTSWGPGRDAAMWLMDHVDGLSYSPPDPAETWIQGGLQVEASADAKSGAVDAGISAGAAAVIGARQNHETGNTTWYYQVDGNVAGQLGLAGGTVSAAGDSDVQYVVGIEVDGDGTPMAASLSASGSLAGGLTGGPSGTTTTTSLSELAGGLTGTATDGVHGVATLELDLTQGDNRRVFADAVRSFGLPVMGDYAGPQRVSPVEGVRGLYGLFDDGAPGTTLGVVTYDQSKNGLDAEVSGGAGVKFSVGGGYTGTDRQVNGAWYFDPRTHSMVQWQQCSG